VYDRVRPDRPWNTGVGYGKKGWDEDYANMAGNGRQLVGLTYWHQWTEDPKWKQLARKTAERMLQLAIVRGEHAYYPNPGLGNDFSYPRKSGWTSTEPPQRANEGFEGHAVYLFQRFAPTPSPVTCGFEISQELVNLGLQAKFWEPTLTCCPWERSGTWGLFGTVALRGLLTTPRGQRPTPAFRATATRARQHGIHRPAFALGRRHRRLRSPI
jgi:hypothetical protein